MKILVVANDINVLSKIYLALVHRSYKAIALDKPEEIAEKIKKLKPSLIIVGMKDYLLIKNKLKIPAIIMMEKEEAPLNEGSDIVFLQKPVQLEMLIKTVKELTI